MLNLATAIEQSRSHQTLNTPAIATLILLANQIEWMLERQGLEGMKKRTESSARTVYTWAENSSYARPFVTDPALRSPVVATIDIDDRWDAAEICRVMRENGIVDIDSYRRLGRNQIRIGMYPSITTSDIEALTLSLDWVIDRLS